MRSITLTPVESSQIAAIGHDPETNTLAIQFKNWKGDSTSLYHYEHVSAEDFASFQAADSKGRHFDKHIKPFTAKYPFTKIAPVAQAA